MRRYASRVGELTVISRAQGAAVEEYAEGVQEGALHLYAVGGGRLAGLLRLSARARLLIREKGIDIVSAQDPFEHGLMALRAVKGTGARLHIQVHTDFATPWFTRSGNFRSPRIAPSPFNRVRRALADRVLPKAHGIRAVSARVRDSLVARYGDRIKMPSVLPIAADGSLPEPAPLPPHPFTFAFMTVGRLEPEKRIEDIITALARIKSLYPAAGLIVVGDGRRRRHLEAYAARRGLSGRVLFLGWRADATALMRSAQCYIQASAYEGYGLTLIEAALARVPIITTDVGIVGEVLRGYEEALVAPPADPAALAVHMASIIEDTAARSALVMRAEEAVRRHLSEHSDQPGEVTEDLARTLQQP